MKVLKRNGQLVDFDKHKIITAINKAFLEVDGTLYEEDTAIDIANEIENKITDNISVEAIQDEIENYLMRSERQDVARAYIRYRYKREMARRQKTAFMDAISEKLECRDVKNQNANVDERSFGGRMGEANRVLTKQYALDYLISDRAKYNHFNSRIYIHDLDSYAVGMHNCLSIPFDDLLANGFNTRQTDVRPAGSVNTAFQLVAVIFQLQSLQQFGGVSATHLDWTMVPYVRKSFYKHLIDGMKYIDNITAQSIDIDGKPIDISSVDWNKDFDLTRQRFGCSDQVYKYALDMTEKEMMLAGLTYSAVDKELLEELNAVKEIIHDYNSLRPSETQKRLEILKGLLGHIEDDEVIINQPFYCDYGKQISVGRRFFANFNLTILDEAPVTIGDDCFIGPNVSIYTACHSTDPTERNTREEWAEPVTIGNNVWIGGSVTILPGVTIGDNVTIGAGSVVTKEIPSDTVAVGNPCKVIKHI